MTLDKDWKDQVKKEWIDETERLIDDEAYKLITHFKIPLDEVPNRIRIESNYEEQRVYVDEKLKLVLTREPWISKKRNSDVTTYSYRTHIYRLHEKK